MLESSCIESWKFVLGSESTESHNLHIILVNDKCIIGIKTKSSDGISTIPI